MPLYGFYAVFGVGAKLSCRTLGTKPCITFVFPVAVPVCGGIYGTGTAAYNQKLSERRAKAVYDVLTKNYGISANRLSIDAEGSSSQPFPENNWNRIVIFVPGN